jgi:hypothetical protein
MVEKQQAARVTATTELLQRLLSSNSRYVRTWRVHGQRSRGEVNQRAVARVLAQVEFDRGDISDPNDLHVLRRLKNTVNRAFTGRSLPGQLLMDFIEGFDMEEDDQEALWQTLTGDNVEVGTVRRPRTLGKPQWHQTRALFEHWYIGQESVLLRRRTVQCIEAREDGVDSYLYNHEPYATQIEVIHGGRLGRHYEYGDGLISDDIVLDQVLTKGDRAAIEYQTFYESGRKISEVRRPSRKRTENVALHVHFDKSDLPKRVWFATWDDHYLGSHVRQVPLSLSDDGSAAYCLAYMEHSVVGFRWE